MVFYQVNRSQPSRSALLGPVATFLWRCRSKLHRQYAFILCKSKNQALIIMWLLASDDHAIFFLSYPLFEQYPTQGRCNAVLNELLGDQVLGCLGRAPWSHLLNPWNMGILLASSFSPTVKLQSNNYLCSSRHRSGCQLLRKSIWVSSAGKMSDSHHQPLVHFGSEPLGAGQVVHGGLAWACELGPAVRNLK